MTSTRNENPILFTIKTGNAVYEAAFSKLKNLSSVVDQLKLLKKNFAELYLCAEALQSEAADICANLYEYGESEIDRYVDGLINDLKLGALIEFLSDLLSTEMKKTDSQSALKLSLLQKELKKSLSNDMWDSIKAEIKSTEDKFLELKDIKTLIDDFPEDEEACEAYNKLKKSLEEKVPSYSYLKHDYDLHKMINLIWKLQDKPEKMRSQEIPDIINARVQRALEDAKQSRNKKRTTKRMLTVIKENDEEVYIFSRKGGEYKSTATTKVSSSTSVIAKTTNMTLQVHSSVSMTVSVNKEQQTTTKSSHHRCATNQVITNSSSSSSALTSTTKNKR